MEYRVKFIRQLAFVTVIVAKFYRKSFKCSSIFVHHSSQPGHGTAFFALFVLSAPSMLLFSIISILFFAAYVMCKKNYSFSSVVFLFFQTKITKSFYSKINDSSRVRTTGFSSSRLGVRVCEVPNIFMIYP